MLIHLSCSPHSLAHSSSLTMFGSTHFWVNNAGNSSCHGFTFKTNATGETDIYFRDETQIFFME